MNKRYQTKIDRIEHELIDLSRCYSVAEHFGNNEQLANSADGISSLLAKLEDMVRTKKLSTDQVSRISKTIRIYQDRVGATS